MLVAIYLLSTQFIIYSNKTEGILVSRDSEFDAFVGRLIQAKRKDKRIYQEKLAKKIGLSRSSIANIECGKQKVSLFQLHEICNVLSIEIEEILPSSDDFKRLFSQIQNQPKLSSSILHERGVKRVGKIL